MRALTTLLAGVGVVALCLGVLAVRAPVRAIAACTQHVNTSEEWAMLGLVQNFRDDHFGGSPELTMSGPLNEAAKGYADFAAQEGAMDHYADGSTPWDRAKACGFLTNSAQAAGGEGMAVFTSGAGTAQQALEQMKQHSGSGIYVPTQFLSYPTHCAGVAKSVVGNRVVWIVLLFARTGVCPEAVTGPAAPTSTPAAPSPTAPPPSATPTQPVHQSYIPGLQRD